MSDELMAQLERLEATYMAALDAKDAEIKDLRAASLNLAKGGAQLLAATEGFKTEIEQLRKTLKESRAVAEQDLLNVWGLRHQKTGRCPFCGAQG